MCLIHFHRLVRAGACYVRLSGTTRPFRPHFSMQNPNRSLASKTTGSTTTTASVPPHAKPQNKEDETFISDDVTEVSTEEEGPSTRDVVIDENTEWGQRALEVAQQVLATNNDLSLYSFRAIANSKTVDIRLDKLSDTYGSPTLDEIGAFSRDFNERFEAIVGEEEAGGIEIEVSSPGATRTVKVPEELERFKELPMEVVTADEPVARVMVFKGFGGEDSTYTEWMYADVKANRSLNKGRGLNKKARETVFVFKTQDILKLNIHIDL